MAVLEGLDPGLQAVVRRGVRRAAVIRGKPAKRLNVSPI